MLRQRRFRARNMPQKLNRKSIRVSHLTHVDNVVDYAVAVNKRATRPALNSHNDKNNP